MFWKTFQLAVLALLLTIPATGRTAQTCDKPPPQAAPPPAYSGQPANDGYQIMYHSMWEFIRDSYFDPGRLKDWTKYEHAFDDKLGTIADIEIALKALAQATGDKWTTYITAQDMRDHAAMEQQGLVTGGIMLYHRGQHYKLDVIHYGSAGYHTTLRERDDILCLNGVALDTLAPEQVTSLLRGKSGDKLKVKAISSEDGQEFEVELTLAAIPAPAVQAKLLQNGIAYLTMPSFAGEHFITEFVEQYSALVSQNGGKVNGLILDLRYNHGGELPAATKFSSLFLDESKVVTQSVLRDKPIKLIHANKADEISIKGKVVDAALVAQLRKLPLVILANGSSASAAEVTLAALKDNKRGVIVGDTSFGKGVGYKTQRGPVGGLMSLTAFKYLSPNGNEVHEIGITPDFPVAVPRSETRDVQLETAIIRLEEKLQNSP